MEQAQNFGNCYNYKLISRWRESYADYTIRRRNGNMCPITEKYMKNEYLDSVANIRVRVDGRSEKELKDKAGKVLALQRKGAKLIFPDVLSIEQELLK